MATESSAAQGQGEVPESVRKAAEELSDREAVRIFGPKLGAPRTPSAATTDSAGGSALPTPGAARLASPTPAEVRKLKKHLRELSAAVSSFLLDFDAEMAKRDVPDGVGRRVAKLANDLDMANDRVRYFALGVDYRTDQKGASRV